MNEHRKVAAVILAAGASSRMGSPKALLDVGDRPGIEALLETIRAAGVETMIVVVGKHAREIVADAELGDAHVVENPDWKDGRTSSIQAGLHAVPAGIEAAMVANVDQPLVGLATVRGLLDAWDAAGPEIELVSPVFGKRHGHPIVIARSVFAGFYGLRGHESPRELLRGRPRVDVPVDDTWTIADLNTRSDLQELGLTPTTD